MKLFEGVDYFEKKSYYEYCYSMFNFTSDATV